MRFDNHLGGADAGQLLLEGQFRLGSRELCHREFASSNIDVGDADGVATCDDSGEEVVAFGGQHSRIDDGTGGNDTDHLAVNQSL